MHGNVIWHLCARAVSGVSHEGDIG